LRSNISGTLNLKLLRPFISSSPTDGCKLLPGAAHLESQKQQNIKKAQGNIAPAQITQLVQADQQCAKA